MAIPQSADPRPETPVEDYLEQQQVALDDDEEPDLPRVGPLPVEAEEADVLEQSQEVRFDDEYDTEL